MHTSSSGSSSTRQWHVAVASSALPLRSQWDPPSSTKEQKKQRQQQQQRAHLLDMLSIDYNCRHPIKSDVGCGCWLLLLLLYTYICWRSCDSRTTSFARRTLRLRTEMPSGIQSGIQTAYHPNRLPPNDLLHRTQTPPAQEIQSNRQTMRTVDGKTEKSINDFFANLPPATSCIEYGICTYDHRVWKQ